MAPLDVAPLLDFSAKALLVVAAGALAVRLAARSSADGRHWIWSLTLGVVVLLAPVSWLSPGRTVAWLPAEPIALASSAGDGLAVDPLPRDPGGDLASGSATARPGGPPLRHQTSSRTWSWRAGLALTWMAVTGLLLVRLLAQLAHLALLSWSARPVPATWHPAIDEAASALGLSRVSVALSSRVGIPLTYGLVRPTVLLPLAAGAWSAERRHVVLLHELAHARRGDARTNLVARLAGALAWHLPPVWWAIGALDAEREQAADDRVLASGAADVDYADHLLGIARELGTRAERPALASAMTRRSLLQRRLAAILDQGRLRAVLTTRSRRAWAAGAVLALAPLSGVHLGHEGGGDQHARRAAELSALVARFDHEALAPLLDALDEPSRQVRAAALRCLGQVGLRRGFHAILDEVMHGDTALAPVAVEALGDVGCRPALVALALLLDVHADPLARAAAARALGTFDPALLDADLAELFAEQDDDARRALTRAFGEVPGGSARRRLLTALDDDPRVRRAARTTLTTADPALAGRSRDGAGTGH